MHTQTNLEQAFKRSNLAKFGYTLETAMQNKGLAICLNRLAESAAKRTADKPVKTYWYQKI